MINELSARNQDDPPVSFLFLLAAAILGQGENEPYFAISTSRTFNTASSPTVSLSAWNVDALEFRVYRVKDPQKFFEQLDDPHQFGRLSLQPPRERSWLEEFVYWKRDLRTDVRRFLRAQFTESPSAHAANLLPHKAPAPLPANGILKETHFPETPVLNQDQLAVSFVQRVSGNSRWAREDIGVPVRDPGVYLVEAVNKQLRAYTVMMISDLTMITKSANGRIVNMVVDRSTGQPVPNVTVSALAKSGEKAHAVTDRDGIAELSATALGVGAQQDELIIFARNDRQVAVNSIRARYDGPAGEWSGYIYTDRPVYRPGHIVHFKGIFRLHSADGYHVPAGQKVAITIEDPDQKPVYQKTLVASANGTVHDDLMLPPGAALGNYFIQAKGGGDEGFMSGNFSVEDYKKPEYEVHVTPSKSRVLEGEMVQAVIDSRYFFGEPVSGAKVKYSVYRSRYWFPLWHDADDDSFSPQPEPDADSGGDQVSEQTAQLDADGKFTINVPTSVSEHKEDYLYQIEAGVTDAANREISGTGWVVATYGSFAVNVTPDRYVYAPGGQATLTVEARDYDNQPVRTRAHVELLQWNARRNSTKAISTKDIDVVNGSAKVDFAIPQQGGSFMVRATARTPEGRDVEDSTYLWVSGGNWDFDSSRGDNVQIVADKKTYRAGETAKLMIVAGQANTSVYVTIEGRDIKQQKLIHSLDATVPFEVPVTEKDEPGIAISASFVRNGMLYSGSKYIRVPPVNHQLNVKITTDKSQYQPGQSADYDIVATGADGAPASRAEFSLGVVDEAIYGVRRDATPDILSFFFDRDYNRVNTDSSLEYFFTGEAGRRRMQLASLRPRSRLAQLKPERLVQPKIRKAFPDTTFWAADVVTDASGRAHAKVEFPDSLTTWRATARGITPDTKVGAATLKTIVRKNVIVRLAVPRFFVRGDEVVISALVHNYLQDAKQARVSLDLKGSCTAASA